MKTSRKITSPLKSKTNPKAETQYHINTRATNRDPLNMAEAKADLAKNNLSDSTDSQSSMEPSTSATKSNHQNTPTSCTPANLKLPQLWKHNLESWISLIESKFRLGGIDSKITKYISTLEALSSSEIEQLYNIPSPKEPTCYDKLIREICNVFIVDEAKKLDVLLNDPSLGDEPK